MVLNGVMDGPKQGEVEVSESFTKTLLLGDNFYTKTFTPSGREFFIFREIGDFLYGKFLYGSRQNNTIKRTKSFRIECYEKKQGGVVKDGGGEVEEFFANKQLQKIFSQNEQLVGKFIRIVYVGKSKSMWGGHFAKVYRVFQMKGVISEQETEVNTKAGRKKTK